MEASGEVYKANKEHFVLVHGAGHGAWCWFKLACLLRGAGHRVSCIDLAGAAGSLVDPDNVQSFDEYEAPLIDFVAALPDGHKVSDEVYMQIVITYCMVCVPFIASSSCHQQFSSYY